MDRSDLAELIRRKAEGGTLGHLTLAHAVDVWQGGHRTPGSSGYTVSVRKDPVEALIEALDPLVPVKQDAPTDPYDPIG